MSDLSPSAYKQQVLNDFNNRQNYENEFHRRAAARLVELAQLQLGQTVLDVATGTGLAAAAAAQAVGPEGQVLGTDFSSGMLHQARQKIETLGLTNIRFEVADADEQRLPECCFDAILCSSAIVYLTDIPAALGRWHAALKSGGTLAFSCLSEDSPSASALFRAVVARHGLVIDNPNQILGTPLRCRQLLEAAGFGQISLVAEPLGFYLQDPEIGWTAHAKSAFGLQHVDWSDEKTAQCRQEYVTALRQAATADGYWNDITMFYVTAQKVDGALNAAGAL